MLNFKIFRIIFIFNFLSGCLCLYSDRVRKYDSESFKLNVGRSVPNFINFYEPWSPTSQRLQPVWNELAEKYNDDSPNQTLVIAKADCTSERALCSQEHISGYPWLLFYNVGEKQRVKFKGKRDLVSLEKFIAENLENTAAENISLPVLTPEETFPVELTNETFHTFLSHGVHFVKFYAPPCVHSQDITDAWEELARDLQDDDSVTLSSVDCTKQRKACRAYEVKRIPSLFWIVDGNKVGEHKYKRTVKRLKKFINDMKKADIGRD